jgi:ferredoxin
MALETKFDRFPRPEFESAYQLPQLPQPLPRADLWQVADLGMLFLSIAVSALAVFRFRRRGRLIQVANAGVALLYFGFFRKGCVCPVGSIQNTVLGLADPGYALPLLVLAFFLLPVLAALFRGRVFCGSTCPFGALQELANVRPIRLSPLADRLLGFVPPLFLATAVFAAACGLGFLVCRTDPFVGIFRFGASIPTALFGAALLTVGLFVYRPYCRWLCPYGWLLGCAAALARNRPTVTGVAGCTGCGRCARACRASAIRLPDMALAPGTAVPVPAGPVGRKDRWTMLAVLAAGLLAGLGAGLAAGPFLASLHPDVALAVSLAREDSGTLRNGSSPETRAFRTSGQTRAEQTGQAAAAGRAVRFGAAIWGPACGLVLAGAWLGSRNRRQATPWSIDPRLCVACGRCRSACPLNLTPTKEPHHD